MRRCANRKKTKNGDEGGCGGERRKIFHAKPLTQRETRPKALNRDEGDAGDNCKKEARALGYNQLLGLVALSPSSLSSNKPAKPGSHKKAQKVTKKNPSWGKGSELHPCR